VCRQKARTKFDGGPDPSRGCFGRLESKTPNDCINFDDTAAAELVVDDCVGEIVDAIDPPPVDQSACNVGKEKCAAMTLKYCSSATRRRRSRARSRSSPR
jgi:hypothetical protein